MSSTSSSPVGDLPNLRTNVPVPPEARTKVHDWLRTHSTADDEEDTSDDDLLFASTIINGGRTRRMPMALYKLTILSAVGGFLFGYDTGVISGAMVLVRKEFRLSNLWHEVVVSITIASAFVFALVGGQLSNAVGRKPVILTASVTFTIGSFLMGMASGKVMLLIGRMVVGIGIGLSSVTVPVYIAESCPAQQRGRLVTLNNIFITGGQFIAGIICGLFSNFLEGWRYMLGLAAIPAVLQFFGFISMPESPRYLVQKGKYEQAAKVLTKIRNPYDNVHEELEEIKISTLRDSSNRANFFQILRHRTLLRALFIGCSLQLFQQLSGINTVMYYSATIIQMAGVGNGSNAIWLASLTAFINFASTFIGLYFIDRTGRRPLLLMSLGGVILSLLLLSGSFALVSRNSPHAVNYDPHAKFPSCDVASTCDQCLTSLDQCGFCIPAGEQNGLCVSSQNKKNCTMSTGNEWHDSFCPSSYSWLLVLGLCLYLFCFAPGMGPLPWTVNAEIYPTWSRSLCSGLATSVNWISNLLVSVTFLTIIETFGKSGTFIFYAMLATIGFGLFFLRLPETKGLTLEETELLFSQGESDRNSEPRMEYSRVANEADD